MKDEEYDQKQSKAERGSTWCNIPSLKCCRGSLLHLGRLTWDFVCSILSYLNVSNQTHQSGTETRQPNVGGVDG
jgi:hypothetical protein